MRSLEQRSSKESRSGQSSVRDCSRNRLRLLATVGLLSISSLAGAEHIATGSEAYYTYAEVVAVEPNYRMLTVSEPVEHCYDVPPSRYSSHYREAPYDDHGHPGATILGGILGGLIGNQFGGGNGRKALTVAGTAIGASLASRAARHPYQPSYGRHAPAPARRCTTTTETREHRVLDGYQVTYAYHGQEFTRQVAEYPGERVRIRVEVEPVE